MTLRTERAAATKQRILDAAQALLASPSSGFTLEQVGESAGVSVQTVLRAFGSRHALMAAAVGSARAPRPRIPAPVDDPGAAVTALYDDYEDIGVRVIGILAEEHRSPGLAEIIAIGRADHRGWVEHTFAAQLKSFRGAARLRTTLALVAATDIYVWKLLRIDLELDRAEAEAITRRLVAGAVAKQSKGI
jgi:AcrR family transcriptional regulator